MPKLPECDHCQYHSNSAFVVCGVHPNGHSEDSCDDFVAEPGSEEGKAREPIGGGYYAGDWIPQPFPRLTRQQQLELLETHPLFAKSTESEELS